MSKFYFLSQLVSQNSLHDVLELLNKLSLPLYIYDIDKNTSDYALIEISTIQSNRMLHESRSGKKSFLLEIWHSQIIENINGINIYISKEKHLAQAQLRSNIVILEKDEEIIKEYTFKETGAILKKGNFNLEELVVISDVDLELYFGNKLHPNAIHPLKINELTEKLDNYGLSIDELLKFVEVFNPHHDKQSKPLQCAIKTWISMQIDMNGNSDRRNYLNRSKMAIAEVLATESYEFSSNLNGHISSVSNADCDRGINSIIPKKVVTTNSL